MLIKTQLDAHTEMALCEISSRLADLRFSLEHLIFGKTLDTSQATLNLNLNLQQFPTLLL